MFMAQNQIGVIWIVHMCVDYIMANNDECLGTICAVDGKEVDALRAQRVKK